MNEVFQWIGVITVFIIVVAVIMVTAEWLHERYKKVVLIEDLLALEKENTLLKSQNMKLMKIVEGQNES